MFRGNDKCFKHLTAVPGRLCCCLTVCSPVRGSGRDHMFSSPGYCSPNGEHLSEDGFKIRQFAKQVQNQIWFEYTVVSHRFRCKDVTLFAHLDWTSAQNETLALLTLFAELFLNANFQLAKTTRPSTSWTSCPMTTSASCSHQTKMTRQRTTRRYCDNCPRNRVNPCKRSFLPSS